MSSLLGRLRNRISLEQANRTLVFLALLLVTMCSVVIGVGGVTDELDVGSLLLAVALGMLLGWLLAGSRLSGWAASIVVVVVGAVVLIVRIAYLEDELMALWRAVTSLPAQAWRWVFGGRPFDLTPGQTAVASMAADVEVLMLRWGHWVLTLLDGNPIYDQAAATLTWGIGLWPLTVWSGWRLRQHQPLLGLAPAGAVLAISLYGVNAGVFSLLPLLGGVLMLTALSWHDARERRWKEKGINFNRYIWGDLARRVATLSLLLVIVAALVPTFTVNKLAQVVEGWLSGGEGEGGGPAAALGLEIQPAPGVAGVPFYDLRFTGLPRRHLLGSGVELSRRPVMVVRTDDMSELAEPSRRYYWRSVTYDRYDGHGWSTSSIEMASYNAGELAIETDLPFHRPVRQDVRVVTDLGGALHVAGVLVAVDQDYQVAWRSEEDAFGASSEADVYVADSAIPIVGVQQLRSAGDDYPDWVQERYLALPDTVPERVFSLAQDLTAEAPTPYDRATAIESHLRRFPYALDVPPPPFDQDVADYFLFDLQEGYCDYYATSMVVLARATGVPARMVSGYASGRYDEERMRYVVTEADAHSWAEVYFPGIGWVEFEPTASRAEIERGGDFGLEVPEVEEPLEPQAADGAAGGGQDLSRLLPMLALGAIAIAVVSAILIWSVAKSWGLRRLEPAVVAGVLYGQLRHYGRRLAVPVRAGDTPYEFARSFAKRMANLSRGRRRGAVLASAVHSADRLIDLYVRASYGPEPAGGTESSQAIKTWRNLRWRLWLARLWGRRSHWVDE